jgi:hypothetical protein
VLGTHRMGAGCLLDIITSIDCFDVFLFPEQYNLNITNVCGIIKQQAI